MLKIFLCAIAFFLSNSVYGEGLKELSQPRRLNLEVRSTNTCSSQQTFSQKKAEEDASNRFHSYLYLRDACRNEIDPDWGKKPIVNNEVTTWLRLKSHNHDTRMIGLGFRFQVAGEGVAQFRLRGGGEVQFRYSTTFSIF